MLILVSAFIVTLATAFAQDTGKKTSSYAPVDIKEDFETMMARMKAAKGDRGGEKAHGPAQ